MNVSKIIILVLLVSIDIFSRTVIFSLDNSKNSYSAFFDTAFKSEIIKEDSLELVLRKDLDHLLKEKKFQAILKNESKQKINSLFKNAKYSLIVKICHNYLLSKVYNLNDGILIFVKNENYNSSNRNTVVKKIIHDFILQEIYNLNGSSW